MMKVLGADGNILKISHPYGGCRICERGFFGYYNRKEKKAFFNFSFSGEHQGPPDHAHGGFIALFLDEVMSFSTYEYFPALLAKIEVEYKKSVPLNKNVYFEGKLVKVDGRKLFTEGKIIYQSNILVISKGLYIRI